MDYCVVDFICSKNKPLPVMLSPHLPNLIPGFFREDGLYSGVFPYLNEVTKPVFIRHPCKGYNDRRAYHTLCFNFSAGNVFTWDIRYGNRNIAFGHFDFNSFYPPREAREKEFDSLLDYV